MLFSSGAPLPNFFYMSRMKRDISLWVYVAAIAIIVVWGCTFVQTKILINAGLRPDEIFFLRFVVAYLLMVPFAGKRMFLDDWKDELVALSLGITGGSLYFVTENYALAYGYCSNVALIVCLTPLVTTLIVGCFYPSERIGKSGVVGSLVALAGMALVVFNGNFILELSPLGDVLAFGACLCWALYSLAIRRLQEKYSNMLITRKVFGYGLLTIVPFLFSKGVDFNILLNGGVVVWGNLLFLACVASLLCFLGWNWCLEKLGTVRATNLLYLNPVIAIASSSLVLGERVTAVALSGAVLILAGLFFLDKSRRK